MFSPGACAYLVGTWLLHEGASQGVVPFWGAALFVFRRSWATEGSSRANFAPYNKKGEDIYLSPDW